MQYTIRPIGPEDASAVASLRRMPGVFENILGIPSYRLSTAQAFIANLTANDHFFVAVAEDGTIIGVGGIQVLEDVRMRHTGIVCLYVHADYQGMGVGKALLSTVLDLADNWLMLVRVELEVFVDNENAIRLYESLGFEKEGIKRLGTIRDGQYVDEFTMSRIRHA